MWHYTSKSASRNRIFKSRFLDENRAYKTRDAILQYCFKHMSTYYILSFTLASLQITFKIWLD